MNREAQSQSQQALKPFRRPILKLGIALIKLDAKIHRGKVTVTHHPREAAS